ncbi:MAG TPA: RDD family protein [Actinomycetota bacterium]|jgi:uncharacterized RDD family membrane protein YckC|nr:RDD family protein [Actinomycetota bacterium]
MTSYPATPAYNEGTAAYAGFWIRFGAALIDGILVGIVTNILLFLIRMATGASTDTMNPTTVVSLIVAIGIGAAYYIMMESSERQATIGKMALGLKVTDMNGARISAGTATVRYFSEILSGIILMIGYIMAAFTPKKQALHDIIAKTLVVKT